MDTLTQAAIDTASFEQTCMVGVGYDHGDE